ncbi:MAG: response regulator [Chloroflexi bacterium HGW-Chloroflexi-10]|nr:MAG: response regulator [Chloroflexi bacterium HGW-Chloroflexi-10]
MAKILIVDDSTFARSKIKKALAELNCEVLEAGSGDEAVEIARTQLPDLMTLDLLMPVMSGQDTLQAVKNLHLPVKVIIVSADIQIQTREELLAAGASAFLNKPVDAQVLIETIRGLL